MKVRVCPHCGARNPEDSWNCTECGTTLSIATIQEQGNPTQHADDSVANDTGWTCRNCGNFNVRTNSCYRCGKGKDYAPKQQLQPEATVKAASDNGNTPKRTSISDFFFPRIGGPKWLFIQFVGWALIFGVTVFFSGVGSVSAVESIFTLNILEIGFSLLYGRATAALIVGLAILLTSLGLWSADIGRLRGMNKSPVWSVFRFSGILPVVGWVVLLVYHLWLLFSSSVTVITEDD